MKHTEKQVILIAKEIMKDINWGYSEEEINVFLILEKQEYLKIRNMFMTLNC
jgi:hypothetical protein